VINHDPSDSSQSDGAYPLKLYQQVVSFDDIGQNEPTMLYLVLVMETRGSSVHHRAQKRSKARDTHMEVLRLN
jgi:hypothetical protein